MKPRRRRGCTARARWRERLSLAATVVATLAACGGVVRQSPEALYRSALAEQQQGNLDRALELASAGYQAWRDRGEVEWHWKFRLLKADALLSQRKAHEAEALLEVGAGEKAPSESSNAWRLLYLADAQDLLRQRRMAAETLESARKAAELSRDRRLGVEIQLRQADWLSLDETGADTLLKKALADAEGQGDRRLRTMVLIDLGNRRAGRHRWDEALAYFHEAERIAQQDGAKRMAGRVAGNLGWCYAQLGEPDVALDLLSRAESMARETGDSSRLALWINNIGNLYYARREFARARAQFEMAAQMARDSHDDHRLTMLLNNLSEAAIELNDRTGAERYISEARKLLSELPEADPSQVYGLLAQARLAELDRQDAAAERAYRSVLDLAERHGHSAIQWWGHAGLADLHRRTGRAAMAETRYRAAIASIDREWVRLKDDQYRVGFLSRLILFYQKYVDFLVERGESEQALAVAESSRGRVLAKWYEQRTPGAPQPVSAARLRHMSAETGAILLSFWLAPGRSFLWVIKPQRIRRFDLPGHDKLAEMASRYAAAVVEGHDTLRRANPYGIELYQVLLAKAAPEIPAGARVIAAVDAGLNKINLETLVVENPRPHYWLEDVTLSVAPSLAALERPGPGVIPGQASLLFIGDPRPPDSRFPPLPHLAREREVVSAKFPESARTVRTQAEARPEAYRDAQPGRFSYVHFAAHAVPNGQSPMHSAVILSGEGNHYKLYAEEIASQPLTAALVTLSACHGAGTRAYAGEGLVGFSWAFLRAGAQNVIAGLWQVDDAATVRLMERLYSELALRPDPAAALHAAKLDLLRSSVTWRKPYYWGSLELFTRQPVRAR